MASKTKARPEVADSERKLFRLKAGSYTTGSGDEQRIFNWKGPSRERGIVGNVVESHIDLAKKDPLKFAYFEGDKPEDFGPELDPGDAPPGPTDQAARARAAMLDAMSSEDLRTFADELQARSEQMRQAAMERETAAAE